MKKNLQEKLPQAFNKRLYEQVHFCFTKSPSPYPFILQADITYLEETGYFQNVFIKNSNIRNNSLFRLTWDVGEFPEMYRNSYFNRESDLLPVE